MLTILVVSKVNKMDLYNGVHGVYGVAHGVKEVHGLDGVHVVRADYEVPTNRTFSPTKLRLRGSYRPERESVWVARGNRFPHIGLLGGTG